MRYFIGIFLFAAAFPTIVTARELFSYTMSEGSGSPELVSYLTFPIQFFALSNSDYSSLQIFANDKFSPDDVGTSVTITQETDPGFNSFVTGLENGHDDLMVFYCIPGTTHGFGAGVDETAIIWGNRSDPRIDLYGFTVKSLTLQLDSLTVVPATGGPFEYLATVTLMASDTVPEPASLAGIGCGAFVLMARRRKQPVT